MKERNPKNGRFVSSYDAKLHPKMLVEQARSGQTVAHFCREAGIGKSTFYDWLDDKDKPEFREAFDMAKAIREAYFIDMGMDITRGTVKGANATTYIWLTKQICNWSDKVETVNYNQDVEFDYEGSD